MPTKDMPPFYSMGVLAPWASDRADTMRQRLQAITDATTRHADREDHNDKLSVGAECIAAQLNHLADLLHAHRMEVAPFTTAEMSRSDFLSAIVDDVTHRALLRKLRGEDQ